MKKEQTLKFFIASALSLSFITSVSAAEPCKAYVRADVGYNILGDSKLDIVSFDSIMANNPSTQSFRLPLTKTGRGLTGAVGAGYAFNDAMRGEVTFDFKPKIKSSFHNIEMETRSLGGSAKVLYDFNNSTSVTPFIFADLGGASVKAKIKPKCDSAIGCKMDANSVIGLVAVDGNGNMLVNGQTGSGGVIPTSNDLVAKVNMKAKTIVTYGAGFGLSFKASDNVNVDLTYGVNSGGAYNVISNLGVLKISTPTASGGTGQIDEVASILVKNAKLKRYFDQSLTAGLRVTL